MANSIVMGVTSAVITGGLAIAWGITAGVVSGSRASKANRIKERDEIIRPIVGRQKFAEIKINDAVKAGTIDQNTALALSQLNKSNQQAIKTRENGSKVAQLKMPAVRI